MLTVKEIEEKLKAHQEPVLWMDELKNDQRAGVHKALARWERNYARKVLRREEHLAKMAFDRSYAPFTNALVAGVDEAGRGPLAGPVVTATVILPTEVPELIGLDDSKAIPKEKREQFAEIIRQVAIAYSIHIQSADKIDTLNIYEATRASMEKSVATLSVKPDFVIVDAMQLKTDCQTASVVKADAKSLVVAAASILAKTARDSIMDTLHNDFPMYNFAKNAGYGTKEHLLAINEYGPCKHHRKTFEPIKSIIYGETQRLIFE